MERKDYPFSSIYIKSFDSLIETLNDIKLEKDAFLYLDTETIGLFGKIRLVQLHQSHWVKDDKPLALLLDINFMELYDVFNLIKDFNVVGHNVFYDVRGFYDELGVTFENWWCTQLALRLVNPAMEEFNLAAAVLDVCNSNIYKKLGIDKAEEQKGDWAGDLNLKQLDYAALDVVYLPRILKHCLDRGAFDMYSYKLDVATCKYMMVFQRTGLPVSRALLEAKASDIRRELLECEKLLPLGFNPNSYRQVRALLELDPRGPSDDYVLADLEADGDTEEIRIHAKAIRDVKKLKKRLSFIDKFRTPNGRIYGRFGVAARSGRSNCQDQNLQQIPGSLKDTIASDKFLVYADFSNLELRTFAAMVGESVMAQKLRNDEDLHTFTASKIFEGLKHDEKIKKLSDKEKRQIAKIFNFSSLYGAGVQTRLQILLKYTGIKLTPEQGGEIARAWKNVFPGVKVWQDENASKFNRGDLGYTALGRPYKAKMFTDQNNIMIQGSGAEVAKLAIHYFVLEGLDLKKLCVFIHDSYTFECDTLEEAQHYAKVLAECMKKSWMAVSESFLIKDLPMPVDAVVAHNWYDCQEDKNILYKYSC